MGVGSVDLLDRRVTGRLAGRLAGRVQTPSLPWAAQVVSWLDLVDLCRELDEGFVATEPPSPDAVSLHEAVCNLAIGCGGWLIHQIRVTGADITGSGHNLEALDASLELLRVLYRTRHPSFSPEEVEAERQRIFNGAT